MNGQQLIHALRSGQRVYGSAMYSPSPIWARVVQNLDLDMVFIDTEHTPQDRSAISWLCQLYAALDLAPVVRIPEPDPYLAQMTLDGGAHGIIAPYVESPAQVIELGGAVKFAPLKGEKLRAALAGEKELEPELADYLARRNAHKALFINIESVPALENLDDILRLPYIDCVLVGPHDLSCSLGIPEQYDHPDFQAAIRTIISKSRAANVGVGIHHNFAHHEIEWVKAGANLVMHSSDISAFNRALTAEFKQIREATDDIGEIVDEDVHF